MGPFLGLFIDFIVILLIKKHKVVDKHHLCSFNKCITLFKFQQSTQLCRKGHFLIFHVVFVTSSTIIVYP